MNRVVNFLQKYFAVISVLIGISILLSVTFSSYVVTSNNHKAAEMYIGELKYSMEIDGSSTNTLTVPTGETIIDVKVNNLNPVDTYYKLLYLKNTNITVKYYESTKDTKDVVTTYNKPSDSITSSNSNTSNKITNAPKPSPIIVKTDTLVDALKENALNASNTYRDKYVELTGRLSNIDSSGKYISLSPINDNYSLDTVMCYVTEEQKDIVAGLKKDSLVTVVGTITDVGEVMGYSMKVESFKN